ncbi:MAG: dTDP-4-dehydrorhamnose 3,5-epimerase [Elusimicrobia bacterium]|nr:dTDP-4-dehydrorhamnose 3,5-epimerase [Elusimicrobiota bacterium]MBD3412265.1 dTDP-4-dehydrorhamnose 3,5-epimerase [Elusimicrobiota bacterium]
MIEGIEIQPLRVIDDERGNIMHMLRSDSTLFRQFGEVYFSWINPGCVKAWKKHSEMTQHIAVPVGEIILVVYTDHSEKIVLGARHYQLVKIPPLIWYGFKCISLQPSLIANCTDISHRPEETERLDPSSDRIPFDWGAI